MYRKTLLLLLAAVIFGCGSDTDKVDSGATTDEGGGTKSDQGKVVADGGIKSDTKAPGCGKASYPCKPFGIAAGSIIENHSFTGFRDPKDLCTGEKQKKTDTSKAVTISLQEFYQWDKSCPTKKKKLLWILGSASWCGICTKEIKAIKSAVMAGQIDSRVALLNVVIDGKSPGAAPTEAINKQWVTTFGLNFPVVHDAKGDLRKYFKTSGFPLNILVELDTMKIFYVRNADGLSAVGKKMTEYFAGK